MKTAFIGMGKLGFPCALAAANAGHDVVGFDTNEAAYEILRTRKYPHREVQAQDMLEITTMRMVETMGEAVQHADIVFVAVPTPHRPEFEGLNRMPTERADFDYTALRDAVANVAHAALVQEKHIVLVVISTCLPGTCQREVRPLLNAYTHFVYNPYFIAMGTTIPDFTNPEFVLVGYNHDWNQNNSPYVHPLDKLLSFYGSIHNRKAAVMDVTSAELTKVAYNVFLGLKIVAANSIMEIAHKTGANVDAVTNALAMATDRVVSPKYMRGGMGDGGGCHPRDQIALSWLADKLDLSYDLFGSMVAAREAQTEWLADLALEEAFEHKFPIVVLGKAYKKGTNLTLGSPAILLKNLLDEKLEELQAHTPGGDMTVLGNLSVYQWDPHVDGNENAKHFVVCGLPTMNDGEIVYTLKPAVYILATDHDEFFDENFQFPADSIVIDPWRKLKNRPGIKLVSVGAPRSSE